RTSMGWCLGHGREHPRHDHADPCAFYEPTLSFKHLLCVVVEAYDHASPDLESDVLNAAHLVGQRAAPTYVLSLLGLTQRVLVGAFDAYEYAVEIGFDHQPHKLIIVRKIERGLGHESQWIAFGLLPSDHVLENFLHLLLVTDQIVIDNEDQRYLHAPQSFKLGNDLLGRLNSWSAAIDHDDVAEFALERAAPRELYAAKGVALRLEQIQARHRHTRHVRHLRLLIAGSGFTCLPVQEKLRPGVLRFTDKDDVGKVAEVILV